MTPLVAAPGVTHPSDATEPGGDLLLTWRRSAGWEISSPSRKKVRRSSDIPVRRTTLKFYFCYLKMWTSARPTTEAATRTRCVRTNWAVSSVRAILVTSSTDPTAVGIAQIPLGPVSPVLHRSKCYGEVAN